MDEDYETAVQLYTQVGADLTVVLAEQPVAWMKMGG